MEAAIAASTAVYVIGLLWFLLGATRRDRPIDSAGPKLPSVAVVIAARDEVAHIETCLRRMGAQCYPTDLYQVIVVDDGSTDGTLDKARTLAASMKLDGHRVLILDGMATYGAGGSKKSALALGIGCCSDDIVLTTDADCDVPTGWIRNMVDHFGVQTGAVVGFSQIGIPGAPASVLASWEGLDFLQLMTAAAGSCALGHPMAASGQSLGFRRKAFDEVGGYGTVSHRVSGDDVLLLQLIRGTRHWRIGFCGEAAARVRAPLLVLMGLLDGTYDADALFFSRDLAIEGDTEAVLAVRNAIEEAELTPAELLGLGGAPARLLDRAASDGLSLLRRRLGAPAPSFVAEGQ
mgnify:CR=1 FL=1